MLRGAIQTHRCQLVNEKPLCCMEERKCKRRDNDKIKCKNTTNEKGIKKNYEEMQ